MAGYKVINTPFYLVTVFSLTLLLVILGWTLTSWVLSTNFISNFKEQINIVAELPEDGTNSEQMVTLLQKNQLIISSSVKYIDKKQALVLMKKELGTGVLSEGMENPFQNVVQFNLKSEHLSLENLENIEKTLKKDFNIQGLYYPQDLFTGVQAAFRKIGFYGMIVVCVLFGIVILLIHQIIKMNIISNRFVIRTMEMVGANGSFIRKPFRSVALNIGLMAGIIGSLIYATSIILIPQMREFFTNGLMLPYFIAICGVLLILSIFICMISSGIALSKYLS